MDILYFHIYIGQWAIMANHSIKDFLVKIFDSRPYCPRTPITKRFILFSDKMKRMWEDEAKYQFSVFENSK